MIEEGRAPSGDSNDSDDAHDIFNSAATMEEGRAPSGESTTGDVGTSNSHRSNRHLDSESDPLLGSSQGEKGPKVKVTLWRLLNTVLVLGLGVYKAVAAYRGQQTAPTTLDWILGVLWAVTCVCSD
ncbi:hypothetical protein B0H12DRAFT_327154 [Mycena haematopus]|nr:hypothetical protein B0H12DRAFT_327154 [Mycena haematopus]